MFKKILLKNKSKNLYITSLKNISHWPSSLDIKSKQFMLLILNYDPNISKNNILTVANRMINQGLIAVSIWGKDCSKIENYFDEVIIQKNMDSNDELLDIITTSHENEEIEKTVNFFINLYPAEIFSKKENDYIIVLIGEDINLQSNVTKEVIKNLSAGAGL